LSGVFVFRAPLHQEVGVKAIGIEQMAREEWVYACTGELL
jgi:hypothetical protein